MRRGPDVPTTRSQLTRAHVELRAERPNEARAALDAVDQFRKSGDTLDEFSDLEYALLRCLVLHAGGDGRAADFLRYAEAKFPLLVFDRNMAGFREELRMLVEHAGRKIRAAP